MSIFQGVPAHKKDMKKRPKNKGKEMYGKVKPFLEGRFYPSLSFKKKPNTTIFMEISYPKFTKTHPNLEGRQRAQIEPWAESFRRNQ